MQFLITAFDYPENLEKRFSHREEHLKMNADLKSKGHMILAGAMLDDNGHMIGSNIVCDFGSRESLQDYLKQEPYVIHEVWEKIIVTEFKVAPAYE